MLIDQGWPITDVAHRLGDDVATVQKIYLHKLRDSDRDLSFMDVAAPVDATDAAAPAETA